MRSAEFSDWLSKRRWRGAPLKPGMIDGRARRIARIPRALEALGFDERDLDAVHANGRWPELMARMKAIVDDWRSNEPAARAITPRAPDPSRQLSNAYYAARQYGFFADGRDPNYGAEEDAADAGEIDQEALAALKARFLAKFPDFESGGGFPGASSYHPEEDDYKRPVIAEARDLLSCAPLGDPSDNPGLGGLLLSIVLDRDINLVGDYRRKHHLKAVRDSSGGKLQAAVGRLALSQAEPPEAAARFVAEAWELVLKGSEQSKPYGDIRVLATLFQALTRPQEAISIATRKFENLGKALMGRRLFGDNVLTAQEYRGILDLTGELFTIMKDWGWAPRDLWDVQGFIWVTCEEKLEMDGGRDADRIRRYALDKYIKPARQRGELFVTIRAGNVHDAIGLTAAHANVCQALRGRKFQEMAAVGVPSFTGPDNSSTTAFTYALAAEASTAPAGAALSASGAVNLILYGPPGTGKTWRTAAEAVKLCDGLAADDPLLDPDRRADLKRRYDELCGQSRIGFVTFHQNFSYEDFVEGLRPPSGEEASGAGLRLDVHHGIFREMVTLAQSGSRGSGRAAIDLAGRRFFKMSLGRAGVEDQIYDSAIEGDYITLGWGGQEDWSDPKYDGEAGYRAVFDRWNEIEPGTSGNSGNISQVWCFRSGIRKGDLVIVSYGNSQIRAIGEVTGNYRFVPADPFGYHHHRDVRWLRTFDEPIPASAVYERTLVQASCYRLQDSAVRKEGLTSLLGSGADGGGDPLPYVLIIDEINRANISKVFGELITLIEPDKRFGNANALRVKLPYSQDEFGIPANLHIVGTMNTADRSIALLDTALRRRFVFREIPPEPLLLPDNVDGVPLRRVLETINDRIEYLVDRDHRIGHAFFMGDGGKDRAAVDATMRDKVIPLLQEYFFEDWSRVAAVLGEPANRGGGFLDCRMLKDPSDQGAEPRPSWSVRRDFAPDAYQRLIAAGAAAGPA